MFYINYNVSIYHKALKMLSRRVKMRMNYIRVYIENTAIQTVVYKSRNYFIIITSKY